MNEEARITIAFVVLAIVLWLASGAVVESRIVRFAFLFGLGVLVPTAIVEWRS